MKILVLTPTFLPVVGGAEIVLYEVYRRLARRHEVCLLTPTLRDGTVCDPGVLADIGDVPFAVERYRDRVSFMSIPGHRLTGGAIPPFSLSAVAAVRRAVRRFCPDVLNVHYAMPTGLAGAVADRWWGIPTVLTMNGRDVPGPGVPALWKWWQRALIALVTDATYVSYYCKDALYRSDVARGQVVYNGVQIPPPSGNGVALREALGIPAGKPMLFALQRLSPEKQVEILLHAMKHYIDSGGDGILVIGGTGSDAPRLSRLAAELCIEKQVYFTGYIPQGQLSSYFLACDVFVFHSTFETFGLVIAQAMSYGKAVVTVRNTAIPEVLGDGGLLVETGDWRALGEAVLALARDEGMRRRLGQAGRARTEALFNWDHVVEHYEAVLSRAAGMRA
ncbi:MAG: glycosyltransferase family 1 protein [Nitrospirae bacterium]|nr:MAG: glycosyltransferase family 1 protein [Nitrospirota bacterium]